MVAGTYAANTAMMMASGDWILLHNDDDALSPDCISTLLTEAKLSGAEVAYGRLRRHTPRGGISLLGTSPPSFGQFGWQAALQHSLLGAFPFSPDAWRVSETGDWHRLQMLLRLGVSFQFTNSVVCDYFPSRLWKGSRDSASS